MTLALKDIPAHELAAIPLVWKPNSLGMLVKVRDPRMEQKRLARVAEERKRAEELRRRQEARATAEEARRKAQEERSRIRDQAIQDWIKDHAEGGSDTRLEGMDVALQTLRFHPGVTLEDVRGSDRRQAITDARQHVIYEILRRCLHLSTVQIGRMLNKDHSTVNHAGTAWPAKAARLGIPCLPIVGRRTCRKPEVRP